MSRTSQTTTLARLMLRGEDLESEFESATSAKLLIGRTRALESSYHDLIDSKNHMNHKLLLYC